MGSDNTSEKRRTVSMGLFRSNTLEKEIIYVTLTKKSVDERAYKDIEILVEAKSSLEFNYRTRDPSGNYIMQTGKEANNAERVGENALRVSYPDYVGFINSLVELNNATLDHQRLYVDAVNSKDLHLENLNDIVQLINRN
jgi:hypothetical protein